MSNQVGTVIVYSIIGCPHCIKAKNTLSELSLKYIDISIDKYNSSVKDEMVQRSGKQTVPQIYFNEEFIGGNEDLQNLVLIY